MDKPSKERPLSEESLGRISSKIADATGAIAMESIAALQRCGDHNRGAAVVLGIGAAYGTLQVLASILGNAKDGHLSQACTDDTILFAALLVIASCNTRKNPDDAGDIVTAMVHSPVSFLEAATMFERLTGRKIDDALEPVIAKSMKEFNSDAGLEMLNQVCANRKPC